jgi:hypothetical protein
VEGEHEVTELNEVLFGESYQLHKLVLILVSVRHHALVEEIKVSVKHTELQECLVEVFNLVAVESMQEQVRRERSQTLGTMDWNSLSREV